MRSSPSIRTAAPSSPLSGNPDAIHVPGAFSPDGARGRVHAHRPQQRRFRRRRSSPLSGGGAPRSWRNPAAGRTSSTGRSTAFSSSARTRPSITTCSLVDPAERSADRASHGRTRARSAYDSARLLPDGAVLCACDAGSEFARLALLRRRRSTSGAADARTTATSSSIALDRHAHAARVGDQPRRRERGVAGRRARRRACRAASSRC